MLGGKSIMEFAQEKFDIMYRKSIDNAVNYINEQDFFSSSLIEIIKNLDPNKDTDTNDLLSMFNSNSSLIKDKILAMFGINTD